METQLGSPAMLMTSVGLKAMMILGTPLLSEGFFLVVGSSETSIRSTAPALAASVAILSAFEGAFVCAHGPLKDGAPTHPSRRWTTTCPLLLSFRTIARVLVNRSSDVLGTSRHAGSPST